MWEQVAESRRKISIEEGTITKEWGGRLPVALVYPNSYYIGMSSLGFQTIYGRLNSFPEVVCERIFLDDPGSQGKSLAAGGRGEWSLDDRPPISMSAKDRALRIISVESQREAREFALVAFSISFELDYFNVVDILRRSGIPLLAADREEGDPLVMAGGPTIFANPTPLIPFFDFLVIGEAEPILPGLVEVLTETVHEKRQTTLEELAKLPGIYAPGLSKTPVRRIWAKDLDSFATTSVVYSRETELGDMHLVEIARGCGRGCCFCLAGYAFRPVRYRSLPNILDAAKAGLQFRKRVGLVAAATSDHPQIDEVAASLRKIGAAIAVSSLRLNPLSETLMRALVESGTRTITFAPEAGSDRLRGVINKAVSSDDVSRGVDMAATLGVRNLKLYYMLGLPTETDEDIGAIVDLTLQCKERMEKKRKGTHITVNVTPFVPKAGTPFQWEALTEPDVIRERLARIKAGVRKKGIEVRAESPDWTVLQAVLARGDQRLAGVLADTRDRSLASWAEAMEQSGLKTQDFTRRRDFDEDLPWSMIDLGGSTAAIQRQRGRALGGPSNQQEA